MLIRNHPVPVIAMVNGLATAAGCQLVASCDIAVASDKSSFATPGVNIGLFCTTPGVALGRAVPTKVNRPCASLAVTLWGRGGSSLHPLVKGRPSRGAARRGGQPGPCSSRAPPWSWYFPVAAPQRAFGRVWFAFAKARLVCNPI